MVLAKSLGLSRAFKSWWLSLPVVLIMSGHMAFSTVVRLDDLNKMSKNSDLIIQGVVTGQSQKTDAEGRRLLLTSVDVLDGLKGARTGDSITIYQTGGANSEGASQVIGSNQYKVGEEIVLFGLSLDGMYVSYSVGVGKFRVISNGKDKSVVEDLHDLVEAKPTLGGPSRFEEPTARAFKSLEAFKNGIRKTLSGSKFDWTTLKKPTLHETKKPKSDRTRTRERNKYRFLCNGIDADGNQESDHCGGCEDISGPRWLPSSVDVLVDMDTRPSGVSKRVWEKAVEDSMGAWNQVAGANIRLQNRGVATSRTFGSNNRAHELFWVSDREEWRRKVGGGERGALGVTIAPYSCPTAIKKAREIYDADLIMNGVTDFHWAAKCNSNVECESIRSTLTHELGHFIGLGHPCTTCSWSIMSALAGYNVDFPLFQDQEGLRALYPDESQGQIGQRCDETRDCKNDLICVEQEDVNYCSSSCAEGSPCPDGYICSDNLCKFESGRLARAGKLGEKCINQPCEDGLVCAGSGGDNYYCFDICSATDPCPIANEKCLTLEGGTDGFCTRIANVGEICGNRVPCDGQLLCMMSSEEEGVCRSPCNPRRRTECPTGFRCEKVETNKGVCLPGEQSPFTEPTTPTSGPSTIDTPLDTGTLAAGCNIAGNAKNGMLAPLMGLLFCFATRSWRSHPRAPKIAKENATYS